VLGPFPSPTWTRRGPGPLLPEDAHCAATRCGPNAPRPDQAWTNRTPRTPDYPPPPPRSRPPHQVLLWTFCLVSPFVACAGAASYDASGFFQRQVSAFSGISSSFGGVDHPHFDPLPSSVLPYEAGGVLASLSDTFGGPAVGLALEEEDTDPPGFRAKDLGPRLQGLPVQSGIPGAWTGVKVFV